LLALQAEESRSLRKQMRLLYDIRSSIVHGGFEAIHPMHNELLDKRIDSIFARLLDASEYGNAVILSCFQNLIARGWVQLKFDEVVGGIGNENGK
jgi:hypothetical protein